MSAENLSHLQIIDQRLRDVVTGVAVNKTLPNNVQIMIKDTDTGIRYVQFAQVTYLTEQGKTGPAWVTRTGIAQLQDSWTPMDNVDKLLKNYPGVALVVDQTISDELQQAGGTVRYFDEDHYQLLGRSGGVMEVFTEYKSRSMDDLPPGISGQLFE